MICARCGSSEYDDATALCVHLRRDSVGTEKEFYRLYSGVGVESELVCPQCERDPALRVQARQLVCAECLDDALIGSTTLGIRGSPQIAIRSTTLHFRHADHQIGEPLSIPIVDIQPLPAAVTSVWLALTADGGLYTIDLLHDVASLVARCALEITYLPLDAAPHRQEKTSLSISRQGEMAAVVQNGGLQGVVLDLRTGDELMRLQRTDHFAGASAFPLAFIEVEGRTLVIHGTQWNRVDVSDPRTGQLLTTREIQWEQTLPSQRPAHHLEYFHGRLLVSPRQEWVADDGWVWHPFGQPVVWNLQAWLHGNVWETEDGPSLKQLTHRDPWGQPLCWCDDRMLAVWGYEEGGTLDSNGLGGYGEDPRLVPAVLLFNPVSGDEVRRFAGPRGMLFYDGYLFSCSTMVGTQIWDIETGERLHHDPVCRPTRYHPTAKTFLTLLPEGTFRVSQLVPEGGG